MTPLCRFASSPLQGGTTPVARQSRFHGVYWTKPLLSRRLGGNLAS